MADLEYGSKGKIFLSLQILVWSIIFNRSFGEVSLFSCVTERPKQSPQQILSMSLVQVFCFCHGDDKVLVIFSLLSGLVSEWMS